MLTDVRACSRTSTIRACSRKSTSRSQRPLRAHGRHPLARQLPSQPLAPSRTSERPAGIPSSRRPAHARGRQRLAQSRASQRPVRALGSRRAATAGDPCAMQVGDRSSCVDDARAHARRSQPHAPRAFARRQESSLDGPMRAHVEEVVGEGPCGARELDPRRSIARRLTESPVTLTTSPGWPYHDLASGESA